MTTQPIPASASTPAPDAVASKTQKVEKRTIAKYLGPTQHTRVLDRKGINKALMTSLSKDLVWSAANRWLVDVTDVPDEVLEYLRSDDMFKVTEQDVAIEDD